jgi:integrase
MRWTSGCESEHEGSAAERYREYIERTITPVLGEIPVNKITTGTRESYYAELRRCRSRCLGRACRS